MRTCLAILSLSSFLWSAVAFCDWVPRLRIILYSYAIRCSDQQSFDNAEAPSNCFSCIQRCHCKECLNAFGLDRK